MSAVASGSSVSSLPVAGLWILSMGVFSKIAMRTRRREEVGQYRAAVELRSVERFQRQEFGVPLHAEHIARPAPAYRLDDAVRHAERLDHEVAPQTLPGLVRDRIDLRLPNARVHLRKPRALHQIHVVQRTFIQVAVAVRNGMRDLRRYVLEQRSAERHVDQLTTAANAD